MKYIVIIVFLIMSISKNGTSQLNIHFDQYKLDNGLNVIFHEDHSTPLVSVIVMYHVGSKNEKTQRTGFAHLFEHMMFQGSQHVTDDEHFKLLQEVGANVNGFTTEDGTTYFEVLPSNHLELGLYLESDRMGFLLPAMTQEKLDNQRDVVKNERRQNYENRPYGTASEKIAKSLFPENHPYSWPVIGYMEDLSAASLDDVKDFFQTYYAPNNGCLVLSGDFDPKEAKVLIQKYFGSIPKGKSIDRPNPPTPELTNDKWLIYEDKVQLPRLYLTWHSARNYTRDDAVMDVIGRILSSGKNSRLYKPLVYENQIAQSVSAYQDGMELSGLFQIQVTAKPGKSLNEIYPIINDIINTLIKEGVTQAEIDKAVIATESRIINSYATALNKGITLASLYFYTGDPSLINKQLDFYKNITNSELIEIAKKYLKKPKVILSVVPQGKIELAVEKQ